MNPEQKHNLELDKYLDSVVVPDDYQTPQQLQQAQQAAQGPTGGDWAKRGLIGLTSAAAGLAAKGEFIEKYNPLSDVVRKGIGAATGKKYDPGTILGKAREGFTGVSERTAESLTPAMKKIRQKEFFPEGEDGYEWGEAWSDPAAIGGQILESFPGTAGSVAPAVMGAKAAAKIAGKTASELARKQALQKGLTGSAATIAAEKAGRAAAIKAGGKVGGLIGAASEGTLGGGMTNVGIRRQIETMPQEVLEQQPKYQQLISQGFTPERARELLATTAAEIGGVVAGAATGGLSLFFNQYLGKLVGGGATGRFNAAGKAAVLEAGTEMAQSGAEQVISNLAVKTYGDPNRRIEQGLLNAIAAGGVTGGIMGGGVGAAFGGNPNKLNQQQEEQLVEAANTAFNQAEAAPGGIGETKKQEGIQIISQLIAGTTGKRQKYYQKKLDELIQPPQQPPPRAFKPPLTQEAEKHFDEFESLIAGYKSGESKQVLSKRFEDALSKYPDNQFLDNSVLPN